MCKVPYVHTYTQVHFLSFTVFQKNTINRRSDMIYTLKKGDLAARQSKQKDRRMFLIKLEVQTQTGL